MPALRFACLWAPSVVAAVLAGNLWDCFILSQPCSSFVSAKECNRAAGAADGGLKVWDKRNTGQAAFSFDTHTSPLLRVEWANYPKNPGDCLPLFLGMYDYGRYMVR